MDDTFVKVSRCVFETMKEEGEDGPASLARAKKLGVHTFARP